MIVYYRDNIGIVAEQVNDLESEVSVDFCDGFAYFTSTAEDESGNLIERKIPLSTLVRIQH